jgi:hypothetical protein
MFPFLKNFTADEYARESVTLLKFTRRDKSPLTITIGKLQLGKSHFEPE